jgi:hypothetical protein
MHRLLLMGRKRLVPGYCALYLFDEGTGQVLTDHSGNGYHGTLGANAGAGDDDPAWIATGGVTAATGDFVAWASIPALKAAVMAGEYTIMAAIKTTDLTLTNCVFGRLRLGGSGEWGIAITAPGAINVYHRDAVANSNGSSAAASVLVNTPVTVGCTVSDVTNTVYKNGLSVGSWAGAAIRPAFGTDGIWVGRRSTSNDYNFVGDVHCVIAYPFALTAAQVRQNHQYIESVLASRRIDIPL